MSNKRHKSILCALSILVGIVSTTPAFAVAWGYNRSYYGGYGQNYIWWPGTWWVPASYAQVVLGFPYRYFTQQTPMPASAYPSLSLHRTNNRYYDSYNTAGIPPYENMTQEQYRQWLQGNGYAVPPAPPPGYLSTTPEPYPTRSQPPAEPSPQAGSRYLDNTYGPNAQLPGPPGSTREITVDPGYFNPNGKPKKPRHHNKEEQVANDGNEYDYKTTPWRYTQPSTPPPVQQLAGSYYAPSPTANAENFVHTLNSKFGGNMSAALFDPNMRQVAHQMGLIDSEDLFDVDLSGDRLTQMKGILQNSRMASPDKVQAIKQMLNPTSVAAGSGALPM